jgi:hypothetical protein
MFGPSLPFAPGQPVRVDTWGLKGAALVIEAHVTGAYFKLRACAGIVPGNFHSDLIRSA